MAQKAFVADNTIPGLGASELARFASAAVQTGLAGFVRGSLVRRRQHALAKSFKTTDARLLRDMGLDRSAY